MPTNERVQNVYEQARAAQPKWASHTVAQRALRLHILSQLTSMTDVICADTGKVPFEVLSTEVLPVLEALRHLEKHAPRTLSPKRVKTPILFVGKQSYISYQPRGTVLVISPWNFPFQLSLIPVLEAAMAGNAVILKPSEFTPRTAELMADLFAGAGWPEHVVQVVEGDGNVGAELVEAGPDYIFFTGSVRAGRHIQSAAAARLIPTTLELGGKDPMIVFADANLDRAVHAAVWGGLMNAGQVCMSVERLYVESTIYDEFLKRLVAAVSALQPGQAKDDDIGLMTTDAQVQIVRNHIIDAVAQGAKLCTGTVPDSGTSERRMVPMVLTDVTEEMRLMQEETFGPVLPVLPFTGEAEAIQLANAGPFGLSASVWSGNVDRGKRVAARLVTGSVLVNDVVITISNQNLPFGGEKHSGIGRYHGSESLRTFCVQTSTMVDAGKRVREVNWFPYRGKYDEFSRMLQTYYGKRVRYGAFMRHYLRLLKLSR